MEATKTVVMLRFFCKSLSLSADRWGLLTHLFCLFFALSVTACIGRLARFAWTEVHLLAARSYVCGCVRVNYHKTNDLSLPLWYRRGDYAL